MRLGNVCVGGPPREASHRSFLSSAFIRSMDNKYLCAAFTTSGLPVLFPLMFKLFLADVCLTAKTEVENTLDEFTSNDSPMFLKHNTCFHSRENSRKGIHHQSRSTAKFCYGSVIQLPFSCSGCAHSLPKDSTFCLRNELILQSKIYFVSSDQFIRSRLSVYIHVVHSTTAWELFFS